MIALSPTDWLMQVKWRRYHEKAPTSPDLWLAMQTFHKTSPPSSTKRSCFPWIFGVRDNTDATYCHPFPHRPTCVSQMELLPREGTGVAPIVGTKRGRSLWVFGFRAINEASYSLLRPQVSMDARPVEKLPSEGTVVSRFIASDLAAICRHHQILLWEQCQNSKLGKATPLSPLPYRSRDTILQEITSRLMIIQSIWNIFVGLHNLLCKI